MLQKLYKEDFQDGVLQLIPVVGVLYVCAPDDRVTVRFKYGDGYTDADGVVEAINTVVELDVIYNLYHVLIDGETRTTEVTEEDIVSKL